MASFVGLPHMGSFGSFVTSPQPTAGAFCLEGTESLFRGFSFVANAFSHGPDVSLSTPGLLVLTPAPRPSRGVFHWPLLEPPAPSPIVFVTVGLI
jgi:hypothetical protein